MCIIPWHEYAREQFNIYVAIINRILLANVYSYFKLAYVAKLYVAIIISAGSTASAYNGNIDKQLATTYKNFDCEIFVYQKILVFTKFLHYRNLALYGIHPKGCGC